MAQQILFSLKQLNLVLSFLLVLISISSAGIIKNNEDMLTPDDFIRAKNIDLNNIFEKSIEEEDDSEDDDDDDMQRREHTPKNWPDGKVYYTMEKGFDKIQKAIIANAIEAFKNETCVRIVQRKKETDYITIKYAGEDGSCKGNALGRLEGGQTIQFGDKCFQKKKNGRIGKVVHEFLHAIGFIHEHQRNDRDPYVEILTDNIVEGKESQFRERDVKSANFEGVYDYGSLMHYKRTSFGKEDDDGNQETTIKILQPTIADVGQRDDFSELDIAKVNSWEECSDSTRNDKVQTYDNSESGDRPVSEDLNEKCEEWTKQGFCNDELTYVYMRQNCDTSCSLNRGK